jgi:Fe-S-cluster-containing dehydrogenase component
VEDTAVFKIERRPTDKAFTVINRYPTDDKDKPAYVKVQCMHCVDPACVSACIVGALTKDEATGAVVYDAGRCLGCRYCMVACPYQIPAYEYGEALKPRVRKCELCNSRITPEKPVPACVKSCPREAILFGRRDEILETARMRISRSPGRYVDKVYGETEVGGADVMYLAPVDFSRLGLLKLPDAAPPRLTEAIQHGVFRYFIPPAALFAFLGTMMHVFRDRDGGGGRK